MMLLTVVGRAVAGTQQEIDHLLAFVAATHCSYERNGSRYDGQRARDHMNRKYQHFKRKISSAEDFIKYAATKSTLSGKQYRIYCPGSDVINSSDWLLEELAVFRQSY